MPNIKKVEYEALKFKIEVLSNINKVLEELLEVQRLETEKWQRYYNAVREALQVEEFLEIPGCFNPMETVEYIVKKQEEVNDGFDYKP